MDGEKLCLECTRIVVPAKTESKQTFAKRKFCSYRCSARYNLKRGGGFKIKYRPAEIEPKTCEHCQQVFEAKGRYAYDRWLRIRFCSKRCSALRISQLRKLAKSQA